MHWRSHLTYCNLLFQRQDYQTHPHLVSAIFPVACIKIEDGRSGNMLDEILGGRLNPLVETSGYNMLDALVR